MGWTSYTKGLGSGTVGGRCERCKRSLTRTTSTSLRRPSALTCAFATDGTNSKDTGRNSTQYDTHSDRYRRTWRRPTGSRRNSTDRTFCSSRIQYPGDSSRTLGCPTSRTGGTTTGASSTSSTQWTDDSLSSCATPIGGSRWGSGPKCHRSNLRGVDTKRAGCWRWGKRSGTYGTTLSGTNSRRCTTMRSTPTCTDGSPGWNGIWLTTGGGTRAGISNPSKTPPIGTPVSRPRRVARWSRMLNWSVLCSTTRTGGSSVATWSAGKVYDTYPKNPPRETSLFCPYAP